MQHNQQHKQKQLPVKRCENKNLSKHIKISKNGQENYIN